MKKQSRKTIEELTVEEREELSQIEKELKFLKNKWGFQ